MPHDPQIGWNYVEQPGNDALPIPLEDLDVHGAVLTCQADAFAAGPP